MCLTSLYEFSYSNSLSFPTEVKFLFSDGKIEAKRNLSGKMGIKILTVWL